MRLITNMTCYYWLVVIDAKDDPAKLYGSEHKHSNTVSMN